MKIKHKENFHIPILTRTGKNLKEIEQKRKIEKRKNRKKVNLARFTRLGKKGRYI